MQANYTQTSKFFLCIWFFYYPECLDQSRLDKFTLDTFIFRACPFRVFHSCRIHRAVSLFHIGLGESLGDYTSSSCSTAIRIRGSRGIHYRATSDFGLPCSFWLDKTGHLCAHSTFSADLVNCTVSAATLYHTYEFEASASSNFWDYISLPLLNSVQFNLCCLLFFFKTGLPVKVIISRRFGLLW